MTPAASRPSPSAAAVGPSFGPSFGPAAPGPAPDASGSSGTSGSSEPTGSSGSSRVSPPALAVLLGPQHAQPSIAAVLRSAGIAGPVALITAGLQEREAEASAIPELGVPAVNLRLHARADEVFAKDPELAAAAKARQNRLRLMQDFYRTRLDHAIAAAHSISVRHVDKALLAEEREASMGAIQRLDQDHLERCGQVNADFEARWQLHSRPHVARHRGELAAILARTTAVVLAGGHVAVLMNRLRMFDVATLCAGRPLFGWSAGGMVLTDRVVLFHDQPPYGQPLAEVLDAGLGFVPSIVMLPNPRLRLRLDDPSRVVHYAHRFAPATCVALDHGARLELRAGHVVRPAGSAGGGPAGSPAGGASREHEPQILKADGSLSRSWT